MENIIKDLLLECILPAIGIGIITTIIIIVVENRRINKARLCKHEFEITEIRCKKCGLKSDELD